MKLQKHNACSLTGLPPRRSGSYFHVLPSKPSKLYYRVAQRSQPVYLICSSRPAVSCQATSVIQEAPVAPTRGESSVEVPTSIADSVVRLQAENPDAPDGHTDVYLLGMSHVSKASVNAVQALISAIRPEVVLVEVCMDRVGLMMNPDGPRDVQLWASRKFQISGLPNADGWPSEDHLLSVASTQAGRAFAMPDVEADCVRLLATGLFRSVRPSVKRPSTLDCPQFVRVSGSRMATVPPLGPVQFIVNPRILPRPSSFAVRVDSSLGHADVKVPEEAVQQIERKLLEECGVARDLHSQAAPQMQSENQSERDPAEEVSPASPPSAAEASADGTAEPSTASPATAKEDKSRAPSLDALLRAREALIEALSGQLPPQGFDISLNGVETGEIEAIIKARSIAGFSSGLENSALGGEGFGIETFKPQRGLLQISSNLRIPNIARVLRRERESADDFVMSVPPQNDDTQWRPWTQEEMEAAENADDEDDSENSLQFRTAQLLSQVYAKLQNKAAETVGIKPGAAWRAALEAASENGGLQVLLGDMPSDLAAQNLADGIWNGLSLRVSATAIILAGTLTAAVMHLLPSGTEPYAAAAVATALGIAAFPFLLPLAEVYLFSRKTASQIENTVRIKEPLQARGTEMLRLPGEDAIVSWPNAKATIIDLRDKYMARTLYAAATGASASPAYILDTSGERHSWRYVMPQDAPEGCSVPGCGDGEYQAVKGARAVVGIVGSAHVGGIVREWESAQDTEELTALLQGDS